MKGFGITIEEWHYIDAGLRARFDNEATRIAHPHSYGLYERARDAVEPARHGVDVDLNGEHLDTIIAGLQHRFDRKATGLATWTKVAQLFARLVETSRSQGVWATEWDTIPFRLAPPQSDLQRAMADARGI